MLFQMGIKWKWENLNKTRQNQPTPPPPNFPKARSKGVQKATSNIEKKNKQPPQNPTPKTKTKKLRKSPQLERDNAPQVSDQVFSVLQSVWLWQ